VPVQDYTGVWRVGKENLIQLADDPICDSSGCNQYKHPDSKVADWPRDYGVPSFGMDRGISDSLTNLNVAEKITGQKWKWDSDKYKGYYKAADTMYNFAPKLDGEMITSANNLAATEKVLDHPYELLVQLNAQSDPICASAGCDQYLHPDSKVQDWPMNYAVPSFGMDRNIQDSLVNLGVAEKITGDHWTWAGKEYA